MQIVCDLHLHSRFSRMTSKYITIGTIAATCQRKGVDVIGSGDAIHPIWLRELKQNLQPTEEGLYLFADFPKIRFLLTVEISLMYKDRDRTRRNHLLLLLPSLEVATKVQTKFHEIGNITSDGRPIFGINSRDFVELLLEIDRRIIIIPAHIWTPWFSLFGSKSGYDSLAECFGDLSSEIKAVETGLSADPVMCWRVGDLDSINIISSGDAHSPGKIMREATLLKVQELSFENIRRAITEREVRSEKFPPVARLKNCITSTIEFFPEEGKYHWSGHAACNIVQSAEKTKTLGTLCPTCGKEMILGVEWRAELLSTRANSDLNLQKKDGWISSSTLPNRPPYRHLVPLVEIIAETFAVKSRTSPRIEALYHQMTNVWSEKQILFDTPIAEIEQKFDERIAEAIKRVRNEQLQISPGYDGVYGTINIWRPNENLERMIDYSQKSLFSS